MTTVTSFRWVPPAKGSLTITCAPAAGVADGVDGRRTDAGIEPEVDGDVLGLHEQLAAGGEQRPPSSRPAL